MGGTDLVFEWKALYFIMKSGLFANIGDVLEYKGRDKLDAYLTYCNETV